MFLELFPAGMCCPAVSSAGGCSSGSLSSHWVFWVSPLPAHLRNEAASLLFCSSLPAGDDILCVPALSHLFKGVTAHPAPMFSHLSVPTGVPFLQSEQSLWFAYITEDFPSNRCPTEMQGGIVCADNGFLPNYKMRFLWGIVFLAVIASG